MGVVKEIKAILLDWRGTLAADPEDEWWVRRAYARLGREPSSEDVRRAVEGLAAAADSDEVRRLWLTADCSAELHLAASRHYFDAAGLDPQLSEALYDVDFDPDCHLFGVEVADVLRTLKDRGVKTAVVGDVHFDLRPEFIAAGLDGLIDTFVLSYEHGVQKPNPAMFRIALDALTVRPEEAVMVGDRASRDGGAAQLGIATLLVPTRRTATEGRLDLVLKLIDC